MLFQPEERVIYKHNPLVSVVCQLRFPLDLRIDVSMPAEFQQQIRANFPLAHEDSDGQGLQLAEDISQHFPQELLDVLSTRINRRFLFCSRDKMWTITLANSFVALETNDYVRWEDFRRNLQLMLSAMCETYQIDVISRLGLRYQNVVDRRALGIQELQWSALLSDFVLGPLTLAKSADSVQEHNGTFLIQLEDPTDFVRVRYGLVTEKSGDPENVMFMLDHDFFTGNDVETDVSNVISRVNIYNSSNRSLFRRCITAKLHETMVPEAPHN